MPRNEDAAPLEMWGGIECSHVRIRGRIRDQCVETGHRDREGDVDLIAGLGLRTLRYPVIWGTVARRGRLDFGWHDARLARLRALGIRPIAGLLHHGWGPGGLDPLHPDFVERFASYAEAVARRYPWIADWTPVNEPVTTARFSYLYGHWHPHLADEGAFLRAVVACARATAEAMRRIRLHAPGARLVQTEDFGRVFSVPDLADQAAYENGRRFLGIDLLTGRVGRDHPFRVRLLRAGVAAADLDALTDAPCPPDVLGLDHYLTSDRFLDTDLDRHPPVSWGGNGRHRYADTAAVHQDHLRPEVGALPRLRELHARYGLTLAITEAHAECRREEQVRWLCEAWSAARTARAEGIPVRAVTSWALFGAIDWNSLLLRRDGVYESGAFDLRDGAPRRTAVGDAVAALARHGDLGHPYADRPGWWSGETPAPCGPALSLAGPAGHLEALADSCRERGIAVAPGGSAGRIRVEDGRGRLTLALHHPGLTDAVVAELGRGDDLRAETHRLLDRWVDLCLAAETRASGRRRRPS